MEVIEEGIFQSEDDVIRLDFVDLHRHTSDPRESAQTLKGIGGWLKENAKYTVVEYDLRQAPSRSDFPHWSHVGNHEPIAQLYWNSFHAQFANIAEKELVFADSPDFSGFITFPKNEGRGKLKVHFYGDIGRVSSTAFLESLIHMKPGDLWITLYDHQTQLIIESMFDFVKAWGIMSSKWLGLDKLHVPEPEDAEHIQQLKLF